MGDSEPAYIWNNTGFTPAIGIITKVCNGFVENEVDNPRDYIQAGRDYKFEAKPRYVKYTYPHPLTTSRPPSPPTPSSPQNVQKNKGKKGKKVEMGKGQRKLNEWSG